jgi:hypothetical protein
MTSFMIAKCDLPFQDSEFEIQTQTADIYVYYTCTLELNLVIDGCFLWAIETRSGGDPLFISSSALAARASSPK